MSAPVVADSLPERVGYDEILAHGLGSGSALGDDIEHGAPEVDDIEEREHPFGVDIVLDKELHAAFFGGKVVVTEVAERGEHRGGAERAAAYAQHHEGVELGTDFLRLGEDVLDDFVLVVRQVRPRGHARAADGGEFLVCRARLVADGHEVIVGKPVISHEFLHHVVEIEFKHCCLRQFF